MSGAVAPTLQASLTKDNPRTRIPAPPSALDSLRGSTSPSSTTAAPRPRSAHVPPPLHSHPKNTPTSSASLRQPLSQYSITSWTCAAQGAQRRGEEGAEEREAGAGEREGFRACQAVVPIRHYSKRGAPACGAAYTHVCLRAYVLLRAQEEISRNDCVPIHVPEPC